VLDCKSFHVSVLAEASVVVSPYTVHRYPVFLQLLQSFLSCLYDGVPWIDRVKDVSGMDHQINVFLHSFLYAVLERLDRAFYTSLPDVRGMFSAEMCVSEMQYPICQGCPPLPGRRWCFLSFLRPLLRPPGFRVCLCRLLRVRSSSL